MTDAPAPRGGEGLFCQKAKWVQKAWDNSSLSLFKACPRKYQLAIIEGWRPKGPKEALAFGSLFHKGLEIYDKARAEGIEHQPALRRSVHALLDACTRVEIRRIEGDELLFTLPSFVPGGTITLPAHIQINSVKLVPLKPHFETNDNRRTLQTLIRSVVWYCDQYEHDAARTVILSDGKPAVELSFRMELPLVNPDGDPYFWCGHIDRLVNFAGFRYIQERKHTVSTLSSYYFDRYSPNSQVSGYAFSVDVVFGEPVAGTIIDAAQIMVNGTRFQRGIAPRTKALKEEWLTATLYWIERAEQCATAGYWPMNEESCGNYGGCQFRGVCSKAIGARQSYLNAEFVKEPWNPLENRD